jgi:hypothetical protein
MDWNDISFKALSALVPVITLVVVGLIRLILPKIPRTFLPLLALLLPTIVSLLSNYLGNTTLNPWLMLVLGGLATTLREIISTIQEHGLKA